MWTMFIIGTCLGLVGALIESYGQSAKAKKEREAKQAFIEGFLEESEVMLLEAEADAVQGGLV